MGTLESRVAAAQVMTYGKVDALTADHTPYKLAGGPVEMWLNVSSKSQKWLFNNRPSGNPLIVGSYSSYCIWTDGTDVRMWAPKPANNSNPPSNDAWDSFEWQVTLGDPITS